MTVISSYDCFTNTRINLLFFNIHLFIVKLRSVNFLIKRIFDWIGLDDNTISVRATYITPKIH